MDILIDGLESRKSGEKFHDFVLDDAIHSIKRAKEALEDGMKDPEHWWNESMLTTKTFMTLFPLIYMVQQQLTQPESPKAEENLPPTPVKDQAAEDIFGLE